MALDVIANRSVNWPQLQENPAWLLRPVGLLPTTLFDRLLRLIQPFLELGVFRFELVDLGFAGIRYLSGLPQGLETSLELDAELRVGAGAVKRGVVGCGLAGQSLDVALAAGRDLAAQEAVHGGPDAVLVLGPLGCGNPQILMRAVRPWWRRRRRSR
ncbi:hypothetical protein ACWGDT_01890 [Streptomyces avermitilis]